MYYGYAHYGSELSQMIETEKELADALQKATGYFDRSAKIVFISSLYITLFPSFLFSSDKVK